MSRIERIRKLQKSRKATLPKDGQDGKNGYTPQKGVDYFDGQDGKDGKPGEKGDQGPSGKTGPRGDRGLTGKTGPKGDKGEKGLNYRADWKKNTKYNKDDTVADDGSSFVCIKSHISTAEDQPLKGGNWKVYWGLLAKKGDKGEKGERGPQGYASYGGGGSTAEPTPDASSTVKGKTKLSVEPVSDPIAVGDNDPRVPVGIVNAKKMVGCGLATTTNITLSGHQTIDGTLTTGSTTVLVKDQTNKAQNGVYTASSGAWTRTTTPIDMSTATELFGRSIQIGAGTVNADKIFIITNETPPNVGVDDIEFAEINDDPLIEDTTPANKFVLSLAALMFGDLELYGDVLFGGNPTFSGYLSVSSAGIGTLDTDGIIAQEQSVDTSNNPALALYNADQTEYMHLDVTNHRLSTPVGVPLEVKMGGTTASNYTYFYINGGQRERVRSVTTNQTINLGDRVLSHTTLAAARTHTLPNSASVTIPEGWSVKVLDTTTGTHADTNNITIQRAGTDLFVGGGTNTVINTANGWCEIMWVNGRWMVVNTG